MSNSGQDTSRITIVKEYVKSTNAWRMKLAQKYPTIHFGKAVSEVLNGDEEINIIMQEYLLILESIEEEKQKPDRADIYKDISVPVATEMEGHGAKGTLKQTELNRAGAVINSVMSQSERGSV